MYATLALINQSSPVTFYFEKCIVRNKQQNKTKQAAKKSEDHHSWLPLVINIIGIQKHNKNTKSSKPVNLIQATGGNR